jgi:hypothetical protein
MNYIYDLIEKEYNNTQFLIKKYNLNMLEVLPVLVYEKKNMLVDESDDEYFINQPPITKYEIVIVFNYGNEFIMFEYKYINNAMCYINILCPYFHNNVMLNPKNNSIIDYIHVNYELFVSAYKNVTPESKGYIVPAWTQL